MQKKAILRTPAQLRLDLGAGGEITPVMIRLEEDGEAVVISQVEEVDDRVGEVWYQLRTDEGEALTLRFIREEFRFEVHSVESSRPERWRGWSETQ